MFESVLVANRGEIAVRVIRTLRRMGIRAVLTASVPDRRGLAARSADEVVVLEGYSAAETYLDIGLVIAAAKATGCQAIHPGYGFLSERPDFAERCAAEGIVFVGPPPEVLRALGDKSAARELAMSVGVPVVPGYDGPDDEETLAREAERIGYPVMIKARGGGGGRGMREVHDPAEFAEAVASARREAGAAFGDPRLLLEKLVAAAHHVEVQVFADAHGNFVHLGERDCSVQRRRQKLIEESPSPVVDESLRERLTDAALRIARAANYVNAGTVEFLVGQPDERGERPFYFLEVNPRLQVEHPVTEMRTGLDLVELQLRIAAGEPLPFAQEGVSFEGHAIEFRINAEDPWDGFRPSSGRIESLEQPITAERRRWDGGFDRGDLVPSAYDSLLAKFVVHSDTRSECIDEARTELGDTFFAPLQTNVGLHLGVLNSHEFAAGEATVDWLEADLAQVLHRGVAPPAWFAGVAAAAAVLGNPRPADSFGAPVVAYLRDQSVTQQVNVSPLGGGRFEALVADARLSLRIDRISDGTVWLRADSAGGLAVFRHGRILRAWTTDSEEGCRCFASVPPPPLPRRAQASAAGAMAITAPLAGTVADVRVREGESVEAGQLLLLLEAMKMEHRIVATAAGTVARVAAQARDVVREGDVLVELNRRSY